MAVSTLLDQQMLIMLCREAGADDVGFVDLESDALAGQRTSVRQALPWAQSILVFVRRLNRHALRTPLRSLSSAEFIAGGHDVKEIIHWVVRDLETRGTRAVGLSGLFPFEVARSDGPPSLVSMKHLAEAAGLGRMGKNRMVLHPHFGADIYIGAIVLDGQVGEYNRPLADSPCLNCNLCAAACPTGAIAKDGHFDFGSCMTHNYREKVGNFVQWIHTIADSRNRRDYRRRVSDAETLSWWQSLGYEANTHCDYCVAVCPAGDEAGAFIRDRKTYFRSIAQPLRERQEAVYVVPGSDAEAYVASAFPHKSVRRIGSGRIPSSIKGMVTMLPLLFQRGQSKGLAARYHFRFRGKEVLEVTVDIRDQHIKVDRGLVGKADMTITATDDSWLRFLAKDCNLSWEMLRGHIRFRGSLRLMKAFTKCFPL